MTVTPETSREADLAQHRRKFSVVQCFSPTQTAMQKTQSSKFPTLLNSFFLSFHIEKGSSTLCLFSNLGPTPTCSKSVGIFILFNLMEGDSNLKLFDFGKQIKYTAQQRVRHTAALHQIYTFKSKFLCFLSRTTRSLFSCVISAHFFSEKTCCKIQASNSFTFLPLLSSFFSPSLLLSSSSLEVKPA